MKSIVKIKKFTSVSKDEMEQYLSKKAKNRIKHSVLRDEVSDEMPIISLKPKFTQIREALNKVKKKLKNPEQKKDFKNQVRYLARNVAEKNKEKTMKDSANFARTVSMLPGFDPYMPEEDYKKLMKKFKISRPVTSKEFSFNEDYSYIDYDNLSRNQILNALDKKDKEINKNKDKYTSYKKKKHGIIGGTIGSILGGIAGGGLDYLSQKKSNNKDYKSILKSSILGATNGGTIGSIMGIAHGKSSAEDVIENSDRFNNDKILLNDSKIADRSLRERALDDDIRQIIKERIDRRKDLERGLKRNSISKLGRKK